MNEKIEAVKKFHEAFDLGIAQKPHAHLDPEVIKLRYKLMREENKEYLKSAKEGDIVEIADALGDMLYVLCGTIIEHGLQDKINGVFEEIQKSNMSKLGSNGQPIHRKDGKVMKGPDYFEPNIAKVLKE